LLLYYVLGTLCVNISLCLYVFCLLVVAGEVVSTCQVIGWKESSEED